MVMMPLIPLEVAITPPPLSRLWSDAHTVLQGIVDTLSLVKQTDLYTVYDVEIVVAEYLQDPVDGFNIIVRYSDNSSSETKDNFSFEKGERVILFLNSSNPDYYTLVSPQGKFTFGGKGYENIYGETIEPQRGDTSVLVIGLGALLLVSIIAVLFRWLKTSTSQTI